MALDSMRFLDAVEGLPEQLTHAHQVAGAIAPSAFPSADGIQQIIVCGMGGSGIAGDVLAVSASHELTVPVLVLKQIRTPKYVGPHSLVFALVLLGRHRRNRLDGARRG